MSKPDPLMFMGLVGVSCAQPHAAYAEMFGPDGWVKSLDELRALPWAREYIDREMAERAAWRAEHSTP